MTFSKSRVFFVVAAALLSGACFQAWTVSGPYRCGLGACPDGMLCDDGVCCFADHAPVCRALVLDAGTCFSGATPQLYFEDLDGDGFGNPGAGKSYCARPVSDPYVEDNTDCDDAHADSNPRGQESCDGRDNNCNGLVDEGLTPQKTFYADQDGDGFGDPSRPLTACAVPSGYVESNSDCGPNQLFRHPGAPELCNGLDDNCDGVVDEAVTDVGLSCLDGGFGLCGPGTTVCSGGRVICASTTAPAPDVCDGLDNNCDGVVDDQPECGGPASLLGPGVIIGAQNLSVAVPFADQTAGCLKGYPGQVGETWSPPNWSGSSSNHHLWYAEAPPGRTWDLSKPGLRLNVRFSWSTLFTAPVPWDSSNQPVIYLCGLSNAQMNRYVPQTSLLDGGSPVGQVMPLAGGGGWTVGAGSGLDLRAVKRVEVLVKPRFTGATPVPTFTITWRADAGFF